MSERHILIDIERNALGAAFLSPASANLLLKSLRADDFFGNQNGPIFTAIMAVVVRGFEVDPLTVSQELAATKKLEEAGGHGYLMAIVAEVVSEAGLKQHCTIIRDYSLRRKVIALCKKTIGELMDTEEPLPTVMATLDTDLAALRSSSERAFGLREVKPEEWIPQALTAYDEEIYHGESTGWLKVDKCLRISPGQLNIVTGVPNHGKSEWLDALMLNLALNSDWRIAFFSPENSPLRRHLQKLAEKIIGKRLYGQNRIGKKEYEQILGTFMRDHFVFFDQGYNGATFDQVLSEFSRLSPKVNACVIDPWNRLESSQSKDSMETDYVKECLTRAQRFVQTTEISLWIVAHPAKLRRDKNGDWLKAGAYDISGSAHWYNIPDNIIMIYRDFTKEQMEVHLLKVRFKDNGTPGMVPQKYELESGRYLDLVDVDEMLEGAVYQIPPPAPPPPSVPPRIPYDARFRPDGMPDGDR